MAHFTIVQTGRETSGERPSSGLRVGGLLPANTSGFTSRTLVWRIGVLVALTWFPLLILTAANNRALGGPGLPFLSDYVTNVRFLIAMPILVAARNVVWIEVADMFQYFVQSGLITERDKPALEGLIGRVNRLGASPLLPVAGVACVVFGVLFLRVESSGEPSSWQFVSGTSGSVRTLAGWWYLLVGVPIFQFLIFLWAWRYVVWCWFLFRLSRFDLALVPAHPDRSAGLRPIGQVHQYWAVVVFAISTLVSARIGLDIVRAGRTLGEFRMELIAFLALSLIVLFAPFLAFSRKLIEARMRGLIDYGLLASEYTRAFDRKWIGRSQAESDLLGTSDIQSLADLANSYAVVHGLRLLPFEPVNVLAIVLAVGLPFCPLAFAVISPTDAIKGLVQILL